MSLRACTRVWESSKVKGGSLLVLLAIADYAKDDGREAFPSTHTLAWKSRLTFRQVRQILLDLQASGELIVDLPTGDERRRYMHIRCVFENWPVLEKPPKEWNAHPAKTSEPRRKSPRGLTPSGSVDGENLRDLGSPPPIPRKPTAGDPLSDPSVNLEQAAPSSPPPVETVDAVEINYALLVKVTHEVLDDHAEHGQARSVNQADVERDVEALCIRRRIPWSREHVRRAFTAAWAARRQGNQRGARS